MTRECNVCGKSIVCYKSTYDKKKYCSKECRESVTHLTKHCIVCGKEYSVAKSRYGNRKNIRYKCCSENCRDEFHRRNKKDNNHVCTNCGLSFNSPRDNKTSMVFCSQKCSKEYMRGEKSPFYSGGNITSQGYKAIKIGKKYVLEHRLVVEEHIGRKLKRDEDVHHIDFNKLNNDISNLLLLKKDEHTRLHHKLKMEIKNA